MHISGSSAIVVGGTGGFGEATVRRLHGAGAKVVVADVADDKGKALESELGIRYVHTDATSTDDVNAALAEAESLGPLRISVDCHGGPASGGRLVGEGRHTAGSRRFQDHNRLLPDRGVQRDAAVGRRDRATEPLDTGARGVIVNTASIAGYEGQIGQICPTPPPRAGSSA